MTPIEEYLETLPEGERKLFGHIRSIAHKTIPNCTEGVSYNMPAYFYNGKPVLSLMKNKTFLSAYPFSGRTIETLAEELSAFECTAGSIHFSLERPLSDSLVSQILKTRMVEVDTRGR